MSTDIISEICEWNEVRDCVEYNKELEVAMLAEELQELIDSRDLIDEADALADLIFVAVGGLFKLAGSDENVKDILLAVTSANNTKSKKKNEAGKITKPKNFVGPERIIGRVLNG